MPDKDDPKPRNPMEVLSRIGKKHKRAYGLSGYISNGYIVAILGLGIFLFLCFVASPCSDGRTGGHFAVTGFCIMYIFLVIGTIMVSIEKGVTGLPW